MITVKNEMVCNKCFSRVFYPGIRSQSRLIKFAKSDGWKVLGNIHYCDKCNG